MNEIHWVAPPRPPVAETPVKVQCNVGFIALTITLDRDEINSDTVYWTGNRPAVLAARKQGWF